MIDIRQDEALWDKITLRELGSKSCTVVDSLSETQAIALFANLGGAILPSGNTYTVDLVSGRLIKNCQPYDNVSSHMYWLYDILGWWAIHNNITSLDAIDD